MLFCLGLASSGAEAKSDIAGRRIVAVLSDLRSQGLVFIYNSQTIDDELRVTVEPKARGGLDLVREILADHNLALLPVAENVYAIVRKPTIDSGSTPVRNSGNTENLSTATLAEVVVQSSRYSLAANVGEADAVFSQAQINDLPRMGDETLRAVQRLPGTAGNGWQSVGAIRGGAQNEIGILLDGMRLYEPFHLKNFLSPVSVLDARLIDNIEVYAGGFPSPFGDRMTAIIDARTVHPIADRYYELGLSAFHANGLASFAFADHAGHVLLTARRSNLSELVKFSENDFGRLSYADGFARLDYAWSDTRFALSALWSRDEIDARKDGGQQTTQAEYKNNYVWSTVSRDWSDSMASEILLGFTDITNDRYGQATDAPLRQADVVDLRAFHIVNFRVTHSWRDAWLGNILHQRAGVEMRRLEGSYRYVSDVQFNGHPFPYSPPLREQHAAVVDPEGDELTAYWDARLDVTTRWAINAGLRFDDQSEYQSRHFAQFSPRAGVLFAPSSSVKLRASWGRFFQAQAINELQVEDGVTSFRPPQHADHYVVGVEQELAKDLTWRIEAYRKDYRSLQPRYENLLDPLSLLPEVEYDRAVIAPSSARADGIEFQAAMRSGPWNAWFNYAWSRVRDRLAGADVVRNWDQTHTFNVGITWMRGVWSFTIADLYHTGWPTTALEVQGSQVEFGMRNGERLNAFNSLDARVKRTFALRHGELDVFLEATNIMDRGNECCVDYSVTRVASGPLIIARDVDHWLGRIPSAGVLWRY